MFTPAHLPKSITPYPWQLRVAARLARDHKLAIEAAPGAGKTLAAFAAANATEARAILIVSPAGRVARQWLAVAESCGCDAILAGGRGQGEREMSEAAAAHLACAASTASEPRVVVIPWSRLQRTQDAAALLSALKAGAIQPVDLLVVDESHYAQGAEERTRGLAMLGGRAPRSKRTDPMQPGLRHYARRCLALSGTPTTSDPKKIRAQLLLAGLDQRFPELANKFQYERRHWNGRKEYHYGARRELWTCDDRPGPGHDELVRRGVVRVDLSELQAQLPKHRRVMLSGFKDGSVPEAVEAWADAQEAGRPAALPVLEELAELRMEGTQARLQDIMEHAVSWHEEAEDGRMLLVWTIYQQSAESVAEAIRAALAKAETPCAGDVAALHGGMADGARARTLEAATGGKLRVLVATHDSTGTGVDGLQHVADRALMVEAPWNPGACEQTEGRLFRTGQTRPVLSEWIAAGIEAAIIRGAGIKAEAIGDTLAPADTIGATECGDAPERVNVEAPLSPIEQQRKAQAEAAAVPDPEGCAWSWCKHRETDRWALRADCGGDAESWPGATVTVKNRQQRLENKPGTPCVLKNRLTGGEDWSLWAFEKLPPSPEERQTRDRRYLAKRAERRGIEQTFTDAVLTDPTDIAAAEAAQQAASYLTEDDADRATERNGQGWSQADGTVGRILAGVPCHLWTADTLTFARAVLKKYARTQISPELVARIWS